MNALFFLGIVVVVVAVGGFVLWLTSRSPTSTESSIDSFRREMNALSPQDSRSGGASVSDPARGGVTPRPAPPRHAAPTDGERTRTREH